MRHADIRTEMNVYGGTVTDEMDAVGSASNPGARPSGDRAFLQGRFKAAVEGDTPKETANVDGVGSEAEASVFRFLAHSHAARVAGCFRPRSSAVAFSRAPGRRIR